MTCIWSYPNQFKQVDLTAVSSLMCDLGRRYHLRRECVHYSLHTVGQQYSSPLIAVGLATSFLQGSKEEWSLVRRHPSEKTFGVQVAGSKPNTLIPTAEVISKELGGNVDFVDINCGCPIDLVFKSGSGSACEYSSIAHTVFFFCLRYGQCSTRSENLAESSWA